MFPEADKLFKPYENTLKKTSNAPRYFLSLIGEAEWWYFTAVHFYKTSLYRDCLSIDFNWHSWPFYAEIGHENKYINLGCKRCVKNVIKQKNDRINAEQSSRSMYL